MKFVSLRIARVLFAVAALACVVALAPATHAQAPLLLRNPSLSQDKIAFLYADDVWTVSRHGGEAERLTSNGHVSSGPFYSPDGSEIAYSAHLEGNTDVYIVPAGGGVPRRITWNPVGSSVVGWSHDGKSVLIISMEMSYRHFFKLFLVHVDGSGMPEPLPLPTGFQGSFSPDGSEIAYQPITKWEQAWKRYYGGQTTPIWIVNLKTLDLVKVPRENSNDSNPVWVGNAVYFLSDRSGHVSLFKYDVDSKAVTEVVHNSGLDFKTFQAGPGGLVYEQFGSIHLLDTATNADTPVSITIHGELPNLQPHLATVRADEIRNSDLSPTGARAAFEAHGEIFTVPGEKGDTRNLTNTPGAAERNPSWSPDGKSIAYFSDASGEYKLYIHDQTGFKAPTIIDLGPDPSYFYNPTWSPDSKHIAYTDKHLHLWVVDVPAGTSAAARPVLVDQGIYGGFGSSFGATWSPDSKWIAYQRDLNNQLNAIFLYSMETHKFTQVTDGLSDATNPAFDHNGKYLYFLASTNDGPSNAGIDLSSLDRSETNAPYVVVLAKDGASPIPPESDDEKIKDEKADDKKDGKDKDADKSSDKDKDKNAAKDDKDKDKDKDKTVKVTVDLDGIGNRILSLPLPEHNYSSLLAGKDGVLYLTEGSPVGRSSDEEGGGSPIEALWRFTLEKRQPEQVLSDLDGFTVSADGSKVMYARHGGYTIAAADDLKPGNDNPGKPLNLHGMETTIDLRAEWRQIYHETWRIERDFLYDPNTHGLSIPKIEAKYQPYLAGLGSRAEFSYLSTEMLGEINVGHMFISGPGSHDNAPRTGLLGADYSIENGRYRIVKILGGQNWTPGLASPLTLPGVYVKQGEYLLAVNGRDLKGSDNIYQAFNGTAGKQTVIHVGPTPDGKDGRDVTVVPIADDDGLRNIDWVEGNRRKVDELSGGKVAYVYMPNTGGAGYSSFNRYFYAQLDKQALVLDERWNEGGFIADYIVDVLKRFPLSGAKERDGKPIHDPVGAIFGPKVMLINQNSGSGGDAMPWYFRKAEIGKLIGTRTWGGLIGIGGYPPLLDGGSVTAPRYGIYGLHGEWEVENHGIAPDLEVELLPKDVAAGHDVQLETGVKTVLEELKANPIPAIPIPPYPNYHKNDGLGKN
ncbi:MAG TPA: PDZ domain-containing protein [Terracidiphilus sp.]|jgi:tricorn protease|nr:PDZ domain-containing protein [Terracidiphilus sp.]